MSRLVFFITILMSFLCGGQEKDYEDYIESLLELSGTNNFYLDMRKVEKYKNITFADEPNYSVKRFGHYWDFWKNFNYKLYRSEFKEKITKAFQLSELDLLEKTFNKFFYSKILKSLVSYEEYLKLYNDLLIGGQFLIFITDERRLLIDKYYKYLGLEIVEQNLLYRLHLLGRTEKSTIEIKYFLTGKKHYVKPEDMDTFKLNTKRLLYHLLAIRLYKYSDHELSIFLEKVKGPIHRRFTQLFVNYHYLFLTDFILQNEKQTGLITVVKDR